MFSFIFLIFVYDFSDTLRFLTLAKTGMFSFHVWYSCGSRVVGEWKRCQSAEYVRVRVQPLPVP